MSTIAKTTLEALRPLAPHAFTSTGELKSYAAQLDEYAYGTLPSGDMLVITDNASRLGLDEANNLPILMKQKTLQKVQINHDISLGELTRLPEWICNHPLAMESITEPNGLVVLAGQTDIYNNEIIVAVHLEKEHRQIVVNEVASVYGKANLAYLIENTVNLNKRVYTNSKTDAWILRTELPLPERIAKRLCFHSNTDDVSKQLDIRTLSASEVMDCTQKSSESFQANQPSARLGKNRVM